MMSDAIKNFAKQFEYHPTIENAKKLARKKQFVVVGMGGSHLAAELIAAYNPAFPLVVHRDYGLPKLAPKQLKESLIIASSYSGNTEEVMYAYKEARKKNYALATIAVGGDLIRMAKKDGVPYVQMPDTGIQPRSALGFSVLGHCKLFGLNKEMKLLASLAKILHPEELEGAGKILAQKITNYVPIIYCSRANETLAWNWKIKFNETGKIPAFYNVLPELNHNEMTGFDVKASSKHLSENFYFLFLKDVADHRRIQKRMQILEQLYRDRGLLVEVLPLAGKNIFEKMFNSLILADWTAVHTAENYGLESEQVPMVEEFKKMMK